MKLFTKGQNLCASGKSFFGLPNSRQALALAKKAVHWAAFFYVAAGFQVHGFSVLYTISPKNISSQLCSPFEAHGIAARAGLLLVNSGCGRVGGTSGHVLLAFRPPAE